MAGIARHDKPVKLAILLTIKASRKTRQIMPPPTKTTFKPPLPAGAAATVAGIAVAATTAGTALGASICCGARIAFAVATEVSWTGLAAIGVVLALAPGAGGAGDARLSRNSTNRMQAAAKTARVP